MAQYTDWVTPGEVRSVEDIPRDARAVRRRGRAKVAVYRDEHGKLQARSALCPHRRCIVEWNSSEKTWDCPCHGSRFNARGRVINGPANVDVPRVEHP